MTSVFPIFCFGVVITGIVLLGILEASRQAKAQIPPEDERKTTALDPTLTRSRIESKSQVTVLLPGTNFSTKRSGQLKR